MEQALGYIIIGTGWPILIIGSIWMWRKVAQLRATAKTCVLAGVAVAGGSAVGGKKGGAFFNQHG